MTGFGHLFTGESDNYQNPYKDSDNACYNAAKYCDENGTILMEASHTGRHCVITVSNDYIEGENIDYSRFFERFYRGDTSHNSKESGLGFGLFIADQQCQSMKAKIRASWKNGRIAFTVTL